MMTTYFRVVATPKAGGKPLLLRKFTKQQDAITHALSVNMDIWDDVVVTSGVEQREDEKVPPPLPWSVLWIGGFAYITDADGKKIASLLGSQARREAVADIICDLKHARAA